MVVVYAGQFVQVDFVHKQARENFERCICTPSTSQKVVYRLKEQKLKNMGD